MNIVIPATAGTMESSDIMVRIEPREETGIELELESSVMKQYGKQIESVIKNTLSEMGVSSARVAAIDKGALDCTIRARVAAAAYRAAKRDDYDWEVKS